MLSKKNKINTKLMKTLFQKGKYLHFSNISVKYFFNIKENNKKISFIVGKNVIKKANKRNLLKRRFFYIIKDFLNELPEGFIGAFIFKKQKTNDFLGIKNKKNQSLEVFKKEIGFIVKKIKS